MQLTQLTFVIGIDNRPLTDGDMAMAMSSLRYSREAEERYARRARRWTFGLFVTGVLMIGAAFQLRMPYFGYVIFMVGIFGVLAGWVVGTALWRPSVRYQRRMRNFLIQQPFQIFKPADADKPWARSYWDYLLESIPDPSKATDKRYGWKLLAKEIQRRTTLGEILVGMITRELALTLPNLEDRFMEQEYVSGEDIPDLDRLWKQRTKEFGVELYETYLAFYPEISFVNT